MPSTKKVLIVQNLTEKIKQARGIVLADYSGLNVSQINKLREEIKKVNGEFEVIKNNLFLLALKSFSFKGSEELQLRGPTAILWLYSDELSPLKILTNFIKQTELPKIKFGFWNGEIIGSEKIKELANLPGVNELRTQLISSLKSPLWELTTTLKGNLTRLVLILKMKGGEN